MQFKWSKALIAVGAIGILIGFIGVLSVQKINAYTSTVEFCGTTCHSMEAYVVNQPEFAKSVHRSNPTGVHATCADCHIPEGFFAETFTHITAGAKDIISTMTHDFSKPEVWEGMRAQLAYNVRDEFLETGSENCRKCHAKTDMAKLEPGLNPSRERGKRQHELAERQGVSCIGCHYNLVHKEVPPRESFLKKVAIKDDH